MAKRLDYPLKASWRQNHSNAMNKSNSDFDPTKIFDRIKFGFEAYEKQHISKPKK